MGKIKRIIISFKTDHSVIHIYQSFPDIQEFYNKKKIPPTNKEEYERDLALALLEVEPVPRSDSGSDIMGNCFIVTSFDLVAILNAILDSLS